MYADFNYCLCCCLQFSDSITIFCRSQKCSLWCLLGVAVVECERVAGGRPTMQDHLLIMVLAETLTSAESTALTFDFAHTLQLVQILLGFICYQHLILYVFVIMSYSIQIAVESPNNSHNSLALVQWLHFRFLCRDANPVENL